MSEPLYRPKFVDQDDDGHNYVCTERAKLTWQKLAPNDLVDSDDVAVRLHCSRGSVYRYVAKWGLKPVFRVGNEMFFRKADVTKWEQRTRPQWGGKRR